MSPTVAARLRKRVVAVGITCMDQLLLWRDVKAPVVSNKIVDCQTQGGGMAGTALVTVARLGGRAEYWGAVGADPVADLILQGLRDEGVDTRQAVRMDGRRGPWMVVCVDQATAERHFMYTTGLLNPGRPIGSAARLAGAGCLLIDDTLPESDLAAARAARRRGVPVVADFSWMRDHTRAVLPLVDYAVVSEACARDLGAGGDARRACEALRDLGAGRAVVTLGAKGLAYLDGDRFGCLDAFPVDVVDTTGAGDVFHGAFCCGLLLGLDLERNLAFASAVAAMKCRHVGGRAGIPRLPEVVAFLRERGIDLFGGAAAQTDKRRRKRRTRRR